MPIPPAYTNTAPVQSWVSSRQSGHFLAPCDSTPSTIFGHKIGACVLQAFRSSTTTGSCGLAFIHPRRHRNTQQHCPLAPVSSSVQSFPATLLVARVLAVAVVPEVVPAHDARHVHATGAPLDGDSAVGAISGMLGDPLVRRWVAFSGHEMGDVHLI